MFQRQSGRLVKVNLSLTRKCKGMQECMYDQRGGAVQVLTRKVIPPCAFSAHFLLIDTDGGQLINYAPALYIVSLF